MYTKINKKKFAPLSQCQHVKIAHVSMIQLGNTAVIENINLKESIFCKAILTFQ